MPSGSVDALGGLDRGGRRLRAPADLDERQQVDRVEGVADDDALRVGDARLEPGREEARCRRRDHDAGRRDRARGGDQIALQRLTLRNALLDEPGVASRLLRARRDGQVALDRKRRRHQLGVGAAGVLDHGADVLLGPFVGVVQPHVDSVQDEPRRPARPDDTRPEEADRARQRAVSHAA